MMFAVLLVTLNFSVLLISQLCSSSDALTNDKWIHWEASKSNENSSIVIVILFLTFTVICRQWDSAMVYLCSNEAMSIAPKLATAMQLPFGSTSESVAMANSHINALCWFIGFVDWDSILNDSIFQLRCIFNKWNHFRHHCDRQWKVGMRRHSHHWWTNCNQWRDTKRWTVVWMLHVVSPQTSIAFK
jgi:hypothetical protein